MRTGGAEAVMMILTLGGLTLETGGEVLLPRLERTGGTGTDITGETATSGTVTTAAVPTIG